MKKRIVISGYYGCGNTGDEAVLRGMVTSLRAEGVDACLSVLSGDPASTLTAHPVDRSAHRYNLAAILGELRSADLVISGGGSLLQDVTSARSLFYYLAVLRLARMLRRRTMVFAQGIGPLIREKSRHAVARTLDRVDAITLRDADSVDLLREIGVRKPPVELVADPALLIEADSGAADELIQELGAPGRVIGVSLRPWATQPDWLPEAIQGIRTAASETAAELLIIPMQPPADNRIWQLMDGDYILPKGQDVAAVKGVVARCRAVVGMRLHSLVFAAGEAVPFVCLSYDPKVTSFGEDMGAEVLDLAALRADDLTSAIVKTLAQHEERKAVFLDRRDELLQSARRSAQIAAEIIRG